MHKKNLTLKFTEDIKQKIFAGIYKINESIPPLRQLAQEYGCSRSVINVGIAKLESLGYIKIHNRQRIVINDFLFKGSLDIIRDMAFCENKDYKDRATGNILAARKLIEIESVKCAIINYDFKEMSELDEIIKNEERLVLTNNKDHIEIANNDYNFHNKLIRLSNNIVYIAVMNVFKETAQKMTKEFYKKNIDIFGFYVEKHKLILQAIKDKNSATATELLKEILEHGEKAYKNYNL